MKLNNRVLIIDDDEDVIVLLRHHLSGVGYEVMHALGGIEGLAMAIGEAPDIVVSDILMPEFDGFGVLAALRANAPTSSMPIVFLTVLDDTDSKDRAMRLGADAYLNKPVQREDLLATVAAKIKLNRNRLLAMDGDIAGRRNTRAAGDELLVRDFRNLRPMRAPRLPGAN